MNIRRYGENNINITGDIISILDDPTSPATISGKILSATIGSTERISLNPRQTAGVSNNAYFLDTHNDMTSGNVLKISNNGTELLTLDKEGLMLSNTATMWDDDNLDPTTLTGVGDAPASINWASTTVNIASFVNAATDEVGGTREIPHQAKLGAPITFHAHWSPTTTNTGNCRFGLEYFFTQEGVAVTTSTTIYVVQAASGTAWAKQTASFATITPPSELGVQFHFRFFRTGSDGADTFTGDAAVSTIGYHYEIDALGSRQITTK
jgi:hypothetical protein